MEYTPASIKTRFEEFFSTVDRDQNGVAHLRQPVGKENYLIEQFEDESGTFCVNVFLDIFRQTGEDEFDASVGQVLRYEETEDEVKLENVATNSLSQLVPLTFINEAAVLLPAMIDQIEQRSLYVRTIRAGIVKNV